MPEIEETDSPEVCLVCATAGEDCDCTECADCDERVSTVCVGCGECNSCCDCWECDDCNRRFDDGEGGKCSNCEHCSNCCDCVWCEGCEENHDHDTDMCSQCNRCDDSCTCTRCDRGSCSCRADYRGRNDTYICSGCDYCECCHCSCSSCNNCLERVDSTCPNCDNCGDCCECERCCDCSARVESLECSSCGRCNDCGCICTDDLGGQEEPVIAAVTHSFDPVVAVSLCSRCDRYNCCCLICWHEEPGVVPSVNHLYASSWREETCRVCHTCKEHCRATSTCTSCPDGIKHHDVCNNCNKCYSDHCNCHRCGVCRHGFNTGNFCLECYNCKEHCRCPKCLVCGVKGGSCNWCKQCKVCCASDTSECSFAVANKGRSYADDPLPQSDPELRFHVPANRLGYKINSSPRIVGIEIETNNYSNMGKLRSLYEATQKWGIAVKDDGSIGDFPEGMEFNLAPAAGDKVVEQVTDICNGIQKGGSRPNEKCGIHVHVDARDVRADDLKRVIDVYIKVERALFNLCHPRRANGDYSQICSNSLTRYGKTGKEVRLKLTQEFFNSQRIKRDVQHLKGEEKHERLKDLASRYVSSRDEGEASVYRHRYRALNLISYFIRRTIEFRHFHGSVDPVEIYNWASVVSHVIDSAVRMSHRQVEELPTNSRKALLAILPPHMHEWVGSQWSKWDELVSQSPVYKRQRDMVNREFWRNE
jgi:Putative amidoligase enzyme